MSFRVWFKLWVNSFFKLLTVNNKRRKHKSSAQRQKEYEYRLQARLRGISRFHTKRKYRKRRSSHTVSNERLTRALFKFIATSLGILLLPFGLLDWGHKSAKARKSSVRNSALSKSQTKATPNPTLANSKKSASNEHSRSTSTKTSTATIKCTGTASTNLSELFTHDAPLSAVESPRVTEPDENTPKSVPKNKNDKYIRKRMTVAGSYYCDMAVLNILKVGAYLDLVAEPDNPYDKDAIKLLYNGQKIGYIAKEDRLPFLTCLNLNKKVYGVLTAIIQENGKTKYEYETWFDNR